MLTVIFFLFIYVVGVYASNSIIQKYRKKLTSGNAKEDEIIFPTLAMLWPLVIVFMILSAVISTVSAAPKIICFYWRR